MVEMTCAVCGQARPPSGGLEPLGSASDRSIDEPLRLDFSRVWGTVDGRLLCPDHQTPEQKAALVRQFIDVVRSAVSAHNEHGVELSDEETAVLRSAMPLLDPAAAGAPVAGPARAIQPVDDVSARGGQQLTVAVTGAFLTGRPMRIPLNSYREVQRSIVRRLQARPDGQGWIDCADRPEGGTYSSGGGFATEVPMLIACRDDASSLIAAYAHRPHSEHVRQSLFAPDWKFTPQSMRIEMYDLGVGVIDGTFAVTIPKDTTLGEAAATIKAVSRLKATETQADILAVAMSLSDSARQTTEQFIEVIDGEFQRWTVDPWLPVNHPIAASDWGRLLWLHPVPILVEPDPEAQSRAATQFAPVFSEQVRVPGGWFVPGIGWSAVVTSDRRVGPSLPMRLVHLQWAYIALYMEIDRFLLALLDDLDSATDGRKTLRQLEDEAGQVFRSFSRVMQARSRVDSTLASLGGDEQTVWDKIAEVQRFDTLVEGVDRKVETLRHITDRRVQEATSAQARRSAVSLGFLATLGLVTLSIAAVGFAFGGVSDATPNSWQRWILFGVGVALAVGLWWYIFRVSITPSRDAPTDRGKRLTATPAGSSDHPPT